MKRNWRNQPSLWTISGRDLLQIHQPDGYLRQVYQSKIHLSLFDRFSDGFQLLSSRWFAEAETKSIRNVWKKFQITEPLDDRREACSFLEKCSDWSLTVNGVQSESGDIYVWKCNTQPLQSHRRKNATCPPAQYLKINCKAWLVDNKAGNSLVLGEAGDRFMQSVKYGSLGSFKLWTLALMLRRKCCGVLMANETS